MRGCVCVHVCMRMIVAPSAHFLPETIDVFIMHAIATASGMLSRRRTLSSLAALSSFEAFPSMGCAAPRGASGISAEADETRLRRCVTAIAMCL